MSKLDISTLTPGEALFATVVGGGLLIVSITQGTDYLAHLGTTTLQKAWLIGMVVGILIGSQVLIRMALLNWKAQHFGIAFACFLMVAMCERFSFITTQAAVLTRVENTVRSQNQSSPEYTAARKRSENFQLQINDLMQAYRDIPPTYASKRENIQKQIDSVSARLEQADRDMGRVNVSTAGMTIADGGKGMARLVALLQSTIPATINIATMMISAARRGRAAKKPIRRARAVSRKKS